MRILHLIPHLSGGGAERQLSYLAPAQAQAGHEVTVAYLIEGPDPDCLDCTSVSWRRLKASSNYDPRIFWQILGLLRELRPDVVQTWIPQLDILGGIAARLTRTPWVCREPNSATAYGDTWKFKLRARLGRRADAIVSNSRAGDAYWAALSPRGPRHVVPNALPLERIAREAAAPAVGMEPAAPGGHILHAGSFDERQKNLAMLLAGLRELMARRPCVATLCGDGPDRPALVASVADAGLEGRIRFDGFVGDLWRRMGAADVFVSVSRFEGRPNTVLEAMACGCPLVVSDIPEHREFLDERSAVFVDPNDAGAIARGLETALSDPEAARVRAEEALRRAAGWSVSEMAASYLRIYEQCCAARR